MGISLGKEVALAEALRNACDNDGKEIDPESNAPILHKLGLVYKERSPDKLCLVQSAALLNAAFVRQPYNGRIKADLVLLCSHVLTIANGKQKNGDLVAISEQVAAKVKGMREETSTNLQRLAKIPYDIENPTLKSLEIKKIKDVEFIQNRTVQQYIEMMDFVSKRCIKLMGRPPAPFAIVGIGSIARKEITPFSDFKNLIVLKDGIQNHKNYENTLEYFRWYSVLFQIILLNLGETVLHSATISLLNNSSIPGGDWYSDGNTNRGVSYDGLMPYAGKGFNGKTGKKLESPWTIELIKPVNEMIEYLAQNETLKEDYHLADIMSKICFVSGSKKTYNKFAKGVKDVVEKGQSSYKYADCLQKQLYENLKRIDSEKHLCFMKGTCEVNIKEMVEQTITLFVTTLGRFKLVDKCSCFDIVRTLQERALFEEETSRQLQFALAIAGEIRLKLCMNKEILDDDLPKFRTLASDQAIVPGLVELVGEWSLVRYFEIVSGLHDAIKENNFETWNINLSYGKNSEYKLFILNLLKLHEHVPAEYRRRLLNVPSNLPGEKVGLHIEMVISHYNNKKYEEAISLLEVVVSNYSENLCQKFLVFCWMGKCLYRQKRHREALKFFEKSETYKMIAKNLPKTTCFEDNVYDMLVFYGLCKLHLREYSEGLNSFMRALKYVDYFGDDFRLKRADCIANIGNCHLGLGKIDQAKKKTNEALDIYEKLNAPGIRICNSHHTLGLCFMEEKDYKRALQRFKTDFSLRSKLVPAEKLDEQVQGGLSLIHLATSKINEKKED